MALRLRGATSGYIELKAPASAGDNTLTLPVNNGSANQLLKTDGSGNLSWTDDNSGVSLSGSTDNTLVTVTGANALQGESVLTFDGNDLQVRPAKANFIVAKSGLTVKANSALHTSYDLIQLGAGGALASYSTATATADTQFIHNAYRSSGGSWKYRYADTAARLKVNSPARTWVFESAVSGSADGDISFIEQLRITSTGQLQATSAADVRLTLGSSGTAGTNDSVHIRADSADIKFMAASSGNSIFEVNGTETFRIKSDGKVGIGTSSPLRKFHVEDSNSELALFSSTKATGSYVNFKLGANGAELGMLGSGAEILSGGADAADFGIRAVGDLCFSSGGHLERMRIDASGRLLIGTIASFNGGLLCVGSGQGSNHPSGEGVKLAPTANTITFLDSSSNSSDTGNIQLWNTVYNNSSAKVELYHPASNTGGIKFHTHDGTSLNETMRIRNDGYVLIGATSSDTSDAANKGHTFTKHVTSPYIRVKHAGAGSSYANHTLLHMIGGTAVIGEIKQDGDGTITYATSSDYRLKENIVDLTGAITRLKNLKPKRFNFKVNSGLTKDGFLAHELQEVVPESVNGTKDEVVTADSKVNNPVLADLDVGDPVYQTADASRVVPLLTAALKEAIAKIETLETKVAALESA